MIFKDPSNSTHSMILRFYDPSLGYTIGASRMIVVLCPSGSFLINPMTDISP